MKPYFYILFFISLLLYGKVLWGNNTPSTKIVNGLKIDSIISFHIEKAGKHIRKYDIDSAKIYLDSISLHEKEIPDQYILGDYYYYLGIYYSFKQDEAEAHRCYYKAIDHYEKSGNIKQLIPIYHNIAFSYIQRQDTKSLKEIIEKMRQVAIKSEEVLDFIDTYRVVSFYYNCLFEKDHTQIAYLDSAIYYDQQVISLFSSNKDIPLHAENIAYNYVHLIANSLKKGVFNIDTLSHHLEIVNKLVSPQDTAMFINLYWIKGELEYQRGNIGQAVQLFNEQLVLMSIWSPKKELSLYLDVYNRLAEISEIQSDYKTAFYYQQKKEECLTQIHDKQKYEIIRELEAKYNIQQKEQTIIHLTKETDFQRKINYLYLSLILLGLTVLLFLGRWLKQKKKAADTQLKLIHMEQHDAMLQIQLQEEQLKQAKFEKYEALLDSHFKGEQISEMDEELNALREEQIQLNTRISDYDDKVKDYEKRKSQKIVFATNDVYNTTLMRDVYDLVNKRLANTREKDEYLKRLKNTDDHFFSELKAKASEKLSALNIKYCLCFYLDMKIEYIADCFSVESRSVHITRHRLKAKLNVNKEIDINTFLKQMVC